jgi:hypothetical protein
VFGVHAFKLFTHISYLISLVAVQVRISGRVYTVTGTPGSSSFVITEPYPGATATGLAVVKVVTSVAFALQALVSIGSVTVTFSTGAVACSSSGVGMSYPTHNTHELANISSRTLCQ